jgi:malate dehydrogenase (quinone)
MVEAKFNNLAERIARLEDQYGMTGGEGSGDIEKRMSADLSDSINQRSKFKGSSMRQETAPVQKKKSNDPGCCKCCAALPEPKEVDVVLIGGGIMSATVGLMLKELEPSWKMVMFERLHAVGEESSNGFNNAGTGHAGFMEPNYTKEKFEADGKTLKTVTTDKVAHVCEQFLSSRQYWAYLAKTGKIPDPDAFIHQTNHIALGIGKDQCNFITKRYEAMKAVPGGLFDSMEIAGPSERKKQESWAPLITRGRSADEPMCMTKVKHGTDVNFGSLTKAKINSYMQLGGDLRLFTTVTNIKKDKNDGKWIVTTKTNSTGRGVTLYKTPFIFVGAGGWALLMLQKAGIPQVKGYMALPVTGDWAVCQNPAVVRQHKVKVYAPGAPGAPPMSMPHLDYRTIDGKDVLLFGPFGSITFKFLRYGSVFDALKALKPHNICVTIGALSRNLSLAVMLMKDVFKSGKGKLMDIRHYYPEADAEDWTLIPAGVRAQIIKKDPASGKGMLQFGTEVVTNDEGTIVGLLGASPGASTCVTVALDTLEKCFGGNKPQLKKWAPKLKEMIPTWQMGRQAGDLKNVTAQEVAMLYKTTGDILKISPPLGS